MKAELTNEDIIYQVLLFLFFGTISITLFALSIQFVIGRSKFFCKISSLGGGCGGDDGGPGKIKLSSSSL